ncbi:hypothetical protein L195_g063184, partial [Trifolium pratense]
GGSYPFRTAFQVLLSMNFKKAITRDFQ